MYFSNEQNLQNTVSLNLVLSTTYMRIFKDFIATNPASVHFNLSTNPASVHFNLSHKLSVLTDHITITLLKQLTLSGGGKLRYNDDYFLL